MDDLKVILIIGAIINIIVLIVFFVMAGNISDIKKMLSKGFSYEEYMEMSNEEIHIGNKEKARELLLKADYRAKKDYNKNKDVEWSRLEIQKVLDEIQRRLQSIN